MMRPPWTSRPTSGTRAVVTGAGSGIGRALATQLAARGGAVACVDVDLASAEQTAAGIEQDGGRAVAVACDVTDLAAVEAMADTAEAELSGPVDLVVNNAGVGAGGQPIGEASIEQWRHVIDVNLWGVVHGCHVFVPRLRAHGRGGVINLASAAGFAATPRMAAYSASKAAVVSISETLAAELAGTGVAVTVVCPTFVRTGILDDADVEDRAGALARRLMAATGRSADRIAQQVLAGHDAGRFYVVPQVEARLLWQAKRLAPSLVLQGNRVAARLAGIGIPLRSTTTRGVEESA